LLFARPDTYRDSAGNRIGRSPHASSANPCGGPQFRRFLQEYVDDTTRNPLFVFRLFGLLLLRYAQRTLSRLLLNEPPRNTRRL